MNIYIININKLNLESLNSCAESVNSMHDVYDELFHDEQIEKDTSITIDPISFLDKQRSQFNQLISSQRILVLNASLEPSFFWFKNSFSSIRYNLIVQQQINIFRMLNNIDIAVS